jgi:hypothetical protein
MVLTPAVFDLYYILVEVLFGSILWAGLAMVVIYIIVASLLRMSPLLQIFILGFFAMTFGIGYGGSIFAVAGFILGFMYFASGLINAVLSKAYT